MPQKVDVRAHSKEFILIWSISSPLVQTITCTFLLLYLHKACLKSTTIISRVCALSEHDYLWSHHKCVKCDVSECSNYAKFEQTHNYGCHSSFPVFEFYVYNINLDRPCN